MLMMIHDDSSDLMLCFPSLRATSEVILYIQHIMFGMFSLKHSLKLQTSWEFPEC